VYPVRRVSPYNVSRVSAIKQEPTQSAIAIDDGIWGVWLDERPIKRATGGFRNVSEDDHGLAPGMAVSGITRKAWLGLPVCVGTCCGHCRRDITGATATSTARTNALSVYSQTVVDAQDRASLAYTLSPRIEAPCTGDWSCGASRRSSSEVVCPSLVEPAPASQPRGRRRGFFPSRHQSTRRTFESWPAERIKRAGPG
jgi:hypothetical protein